MEFKDSITYQNLQKGLDVELTAHAKYMIYSAKAREDGFQEIGNILDETAHNELEHAKVWMKLLNNGKIPPTLENLQESSKNESYEWSTMYEEFSKTAKQEGYGNIASLFHGVANIERNHDARFRVLIQNIITEQVFCKSNEVVWICLNCGNLMYGNCAPLECPVCFYPQSYYAVYNGI